MKKYLHRNWLASVCALLITGLPLPAVADDVDREIMHSDWLPLVVGYRGKTAGTQLRSIENDDNGESRTVTLAIPKSAVADRNAIEEVVVVGQRPHKPEPLDITYEWLDDYDHDNYGLVIHLGNKDSDWPIRLYLYSNAGFIR